MSFLNRKHTTNENQTPASKETLYYDRNGKLVGITRSHSDLGLTGDAAADAIQRHARNTIDALDIKYGHYHPRQPGDYIVPDDGQLDMSCRGRIPGLPNGYFISGDHVFDAKGHDHGPKGNFSG